jgi:beta-glucosidase
MAEGMKDLFPADFVWGAATASYQIEGAYNEDGRGMSIWDTFSHASGNVHNGDTGDVACDHYHHTDEDIGLMRQLGLGAYRFSIAWPRVLPDGTGAVNAAGLDFYDRLVDGLLSAGITPYVTLYHWDLPQSLQDRGGWVMRETADAYTRYADIVSRRLGDRVHHWITHNEPWVAAFIGYLEGRHAPGLRDDTAAVAAAHHLLLSHGMAVPILRANSAGAQVGITLNLNHVEPASSSEADRDAADRVDAGLNRWFLDPIFRGNYPELGLMMHAVRGATPPVHDGDFDCIKAPIDFLGVNNYFRTVVKSGPRADGTDDEHVQPVGEYTAMGWEVHPDSLRALLVRVARDYHPARLYVTENGAAYEDTVATDGQVHDPERTRYLQVHIGAVGRAVAEGAPVKGYFVWSLLDNFEWAEGFSKRFGVIYVDFVTQRRVVKDSGLWYGRMISARGPGA